MSKWQNVDAGPRQVKDLNTAIGALNMEGKTFTEVMGVVGGEEHRMTMTDLFGQARPEVTALADAIGETYGWQVTKATVRAIIADFEAALTEAAKSRPVKDERRSAEEDAEITATMAARDAEDRARQDGYAAMLTQVMAKAPAAAKALIVAEYHVDTSDPMSDYSGNKTTRTVAIGFRSGSREDFRQLHAAAAAFPETAHLGSDETFTAWVTEHRGAESYLARESTEHRDNYSMGRGNYLSDHGWDGGGSGWVVKSVAFPCKWANLTEDAIPGQPGGHDSGPGFYDQRGNWIPQGTSAGLVTVSPSSLGRDGVVEVRFAHRPADDVISGLKAHGFRWARGNRCWYGRDTAYAEALAGA